MSFLAVAGMGMIGAVVGGIAWLLIEWRRASIDGSRVVPTLRREWFPTAAAGIVTAVSLLASNPWPLTWSQTPPFWEPFRVVSLLAGSIASAGIATATIALRARQGDRVRSADASWKGRRPEPRVVVLTATVLLAAVVLAVPFASSTPVPPEGPTFTVTIGSTTMSSAPFPGAEYAVPVAVLTVVLLSVFAWAWVTSGASSVRHVANPIERQDRRDLEWIAYTATRVGLLSTTGLLLLIMGQSVFSVGTGLVVATNSSSALFPIAMGLVLSFGGGAAGGYSALVLVGPLLGPRSRHNTRIAEFADDRYRS